MNHVKRILIPFAHPVVRQSRVNRVPAQQVHGTAGDPLHNLVAAFPSFSTFGFRPNKPGWRPNDRKAYLAGAGERIADLERLRPEQTQVQDEKCEMGWDTASLRADRGKMSAGD